MCLQIVCFLLVRPVSKSTHRKINKVVAELLWLELIWLIDWWAGIKVCFFLKVVHVYAFTSHLLKNIITDLSFSSRSFFRDKCTVVGSIWLINQCIHILGQIDNLKFLVCLQFVGVVELLEECDCMNRQMKWLYENLNLCGSAKAKYLLKLQNEQRRRKLTYTMMQNLLWKPCSIFWF